MSPEYPDLSETLALALETLDRAIAARDGWRTAACSRAEYLKSTGQAEDYRQFKVEQELK